MQTAVARKTNAGMGWYLADETAMLAALKALTDWDGDVTRVGDVWQLTLRASGKQTIIATAAVWLVEDDGLKLIDRATFKSTYNADNFPPEAEPDPPAPEGDQASEVAQSIEQTSAADEDALAVNLLQPDELDTKDTGERGVHPNA